MTAIAPLPTSWQNAFGASVATLSRVAAYTLPQALDRRILELGERKETLNDDERAELFAWVDFTQQRSIEKLQAELALRRMTAIYPDFAQQP